MARIQRTFLLLLFSLFQLAAVVQAQEEVFVSDSSVDYSYGEEITFSLVIHNAGSVREATLQFRPELSSNLFELDVPFRPGDVISMTQTVRVDDLGIRPFSQVSYSWNLETDSGAQRVPERSFTYEDDRIPWQTMERNGITAHWTGGGPMAGQNVIDVADRALVRLLDLLPLAVVDDIDIYVYPSTAELREALDRSGVPETANDQRQMGVIHVTSINPRTSESDLERSVPYELAQLIFHRTAGENISAVPWWLIEGVSRSTGSFTNPRQDQLLRNAVEAGETIPLWRLCEEPRDTGDRKELAVAQSVSLVQYILDSQAPGALREMVAASLEGDNCEQSVERALDNSLEELEADWLRNFAQPSRMLTFLTGAGIWLILLIAGTLFAGIFIVIAR